MAINVTGPGSRSNPGNDFIQGTSGNDVLWAGDGHDVIEGGAGADTIYGDGPSGFDVDTVTYANSSAGVDVDLTRAVQKGGDAEGDQLFDIENLIGSAFNDSLRGDAGDNRLEGGRGLDTLSGGAGNDLLFGGIDGKADIVDGGAGVDTVDYSDARGSMTIKLNETVRDGIVLVQQDGSAIVDASVGSFTVNGRTYSFSIPEVIEDILRGVENVIGTDYNDTIYGNNLNNVLEGGKGADYIDGKIGSDTVSYAGPLRVVTQADLELGINVDLTRELQFGGDAEGDRLFSIENVIGSTGNDIIRGSSLNNRLEGGIGDDNLYGRDGADTLVSGLGSDYLDGGAGADTFLYTDTKDSGYGYHPSSFGFLQISYGVDTIANFETGIDKIDVRSIDANTNLDGDQAFVFVSNFTGAGGEIILSGGVLRADVNGDKYAELSINVSGAARGDVML